MLICSHQFKAEKHSPSDGPSNLVYVVERYSAALLEFFQYLKDF
jgi:hypothetical protein